MARNLKSVADFAAAGPFTVNQLRWWIFNAQTNGLAASGALVRVGQRRIYIDELRFEVWLDMQQPRPPQVASTKREART